MATRAEQSTNPPFAWRLALGNEVRVSDRGKATSALAGARSSNLLARFHLADDCLRSRQVTLDDSASKVRQVDVPFGWARRAGSL
jgi:hypothetical protein